MVSRWAPLCCWAILGVAACPSVVHADAPTPPRDSEALVSPQRIPGLSLDSSRVPANVTVITAEDIARLHASTITDVLAQAEGVTVMDQQGFGLGADGTLNLRGIVNSARTNALVLVDGVRQNRLTGDEVHWQSIPVGQIERIEIIRGAGGAIYGEGALAGVMNIVTQRDSDKLLETEEGVQFGSFGLQQYHVGARGRLDHFRYGTDYTRSLLTGYRESSKSRGTAVSTHAGVDLLPTLSVDVHVHHSEDTTGFPGLLTLAQTQQRRIQTNPFHGVNTNALDQVSLDLRAGPWDGWTGLLTVYWKRWLQASQDSINFNSFTVTPSHGLNLRSSQVWSNSTLQNVIVNGVELFDDKATTGDRDSFAGPDSESNRFGYGMYVEDTLTLLDRISLVGGLRYDRSRFTEALSFPAFEGTLRFQGFSPKLGLTVVAIPDALQFFAAYARPFKGPNVDDFSARLDTSGLPFVGNVDLKPQQGNTYELGARLTSGLLKSTATAFYSLIDREILLNSVALPFSTNDNFDTRRFGIELSNVVEWRQKARAHLRYMFVDALFREGQFVGNTIPGTPKHTLHAGAGVSPFRGFWVDLDWAVVNDFYRVNDIRNDLGKADNFGVLNLLCQYELPRPDKASALWPRTTAFLRVDNITNEEFSVFQSSNGRNLITGAGEAPSPPTTVTAGLTVVF